MDDGRIDGKMALHLRSGNWNLSDDVKFELSTNLYSITEEGADYIRQHCPDWENHISIIRFEATTTVRKYVLEDAMSKQHVLKATMSQMAHMLASEIMKAVEPVIRQR